MKIHFKQSVIGVQSDGSALLMITIPKDQNSVYDEISALDGDKLKVCEITYHRDKRSLDANAFAWVVMDKIAKKLNTTSEEIYIKMLKRYGVHEFVGALEKTRPALEKLCKIVEEIKDTEINGTPAKTYKLIIGSSKYDTAQMSKFINGIVDDAKNIGIETMTPDELSQMLERWKV